MNLVQVPPEIDRDDLDKRGPDGYRFTDLTGRKYGGCTIVGLAGFLKKYSTWLCRCSCGGLFLCRGNTVFRGPSCGCRRKIGRAHPLIGTPTHNAYMRMAATARRVMAPRWNTFTKFVDDMGEIPDGLTHVGRVDDTLPYRKDNCFYGTAEECLNCPRVMYTVDGRTGDMAFWAKVTGVTRERIRQRILQCKLKGLDIREALTTPSGKVMPTLAVRQMEKMAAKSAERQKALNNKLAIKQWGVSADTLTKLDEFCLSLLNGKVNVVREEDWFGLDKDKFSRYLRRVLYQHAGCTHCIHFRYLGGVMLVQSQFAIKDGVVTKVEHDQKRQETDSSNHRTAQ